MLSCVRSVKEPNLEILMGAYAFLFDLLLMLVTPRIKFLLVHYVSYIQPFSHKEAI
jgi:hypothetical protein